MEIICTQCGARLPYENARYCNNCGSLLSSPASRSMSASSVEGAASSVPANIQQNRGGSRAPLREQVAQQPPATPVRSVRPSSPDHPPSWMGELERSDRSRTQADPLRMKRSMETTGGQRRRDVADVSVLSGQEQQQSPVREREIEGGLPLQEVPAQAQDVADKPTQAYIPAAGPVRRPISSTAGPAARELRVKVWPQEGLVERVQPERELESLGSTRSETGMTDNDTSLDELPTRPLEASPPANPVGHTVNPPLAERPQESGISDVERLNTTPLIAPAVTISKPGASPTRIPVSPVPPVSPLPALAPAQVGRPEPIRPSPIATRTGKARRAKRSSHSSLLVLLVALALLIVGGLTAWIIVLHPFTVPAVTQPRQGFSNTQLGLSVLYPSGWTANADAGKGTVIFSDSSHTGQVEIVVSAATGDLNQTLSQQESRLDMTGVKPGNALSFAGMSWQQVQGSLQESGANYTAVLLAAVHGSHTYTIIQMAPQVTYTDEDQLIFSSMRSSFQFLP